MEIRIVNTADILKCPKMSLLPSHYRDDGTCKCIDEEEKDNGRDTA